MGRKISKEQQEKMQAARRARMAAANDESEDSNESSQPSPINTAHPDEDPFGVGSTVFASGEFEEALGITEGSGAELPIRGQTKPSGESRAMTPAVPDSEGPIRLTSPPPPRASTEGASQGNEATREAWSETNVDDNNAISVRSSSVEPPPSTTWSETRVTCVLAQACGEKAEAACHHCSKRGGGVFVGCHECKEWTAGCVGCHWHNSTDRCELRDQSQAKARPGSQKKVPMEGVARMNELLKGVRKNRYVEFGADVGKISCEGWKHAVDEAERVLDMVKIGAKLGEGQKGTDELYERTEWPEKSS
ncbi:hypothetical protein KEM55_001906 [Ascosphaera atra]|nr:hypothetical protein KEM55_001906 [Ascosphaera atra]